MVLIITKDNGYQLYQHVNVSKCVDNKCYCENEIRLEDLDSYDVILFRV